MRDTTTRCQDPSEIDGNVDEYVYAGTGRVYMVREFRIMNHDITFGQFTDTLAFIDILVSIMPIFPPITSF